MTIWSAGITRGVPRQALGWGACPRPGWHRSAERGEQWGSLTWAHVLLLLHVRHVEAPQVHRGHAECELANGPSLSQPIREPGQVAVAVQVVGVEAPGRGRDRGNTCHSEKGSGGLPLAAQSGPNLCAPLPSTIVLEAWGSVSLCVTGLPREPRPFYCQVTNDKLQTTAIFTCRPHPVDASGF